MTGPTVSSLDVLDFWWQAGACQMVCQDDKFDARCEDGFLKRHCGLPPSGDLDHWLDTADGALALVLLLDQMPRNVYRGTPKAFQRRQKGRRHCRKVPGEGV